MAQASLSHPERTFGSVRLTAPYLPEDPFRFRASRLRASSSSRFGTATRRFARSSKRSNSSERCSGLAMRLAMRRGYQRHPRHMLPPGSQGEREKMGRRRENLPILSDEILDRLREMPKPIRDLTWDVDLLAPKKIDGASRKARYYIHDLDLNGVPGTLFVFTRFTIANPRDFTAGLGLDDGTDLYWLLRCNGYHPMIHRNAMENTVVPPETRHIHTATERYLASRDHRHDGFAEATDAYDDLPGAVDELWRRTNMTAEGWWRL